MTIFDDVREAIRDAFPDAREMELGHDIVTWVTSNEPRGELGLYRLSLGRVVVHAALSEKLTSMPIPRWIIEGTDTISTMIVEASAYLTIARHAIVYRFSEAPAELRALSENGGDEDWLVVVPREWLTGWDGTGPLTWIDRMASCNDPDRYDLPDGRIVFIGSHS